MAAARTAQAGARLSAVRPAVSPGGAGQSGKPATTANPLQAQAGGGAQSGASRSEAAAAAGASRPAPAPSSTRPTASNGSGHAQPPTSGKE